MLMQNLRQSGKSLLKVANLGNLWEKVFNLFLYVSFCYRLFKKLYHMTIEWLEVRKTNWCKNFANLGNPCKKNSIYFLYRLFKKFITLQLNDWKSRKQIFAKTLQIWAILAKNLGKLCIQSLHFFLFFLWLQAFQKAITCSVVQFNEVQKQN